MTIGVIDDNVGTLSTVVEIPIVMVVVTSMMVVVSLPMVVVVELVMVTVVSTKRLLSNVRIV